MSGFRGEYSRPTEEHAALVGHIVMDWAIAEFNLRLLLSRLSLAPDYPARRLTDRMGPTEVIKKIGWLINMHGSHYLFDFVREDVCAAADAAKKLAISAYQKRNMFAHHIGLRDTDEAIDLFSLGGQYPEPNSYSERYSTEDLKKLLDTVKCANEALEEVISMIPERPEWVAGASSE